MFFAEFFKEYPPNDPNWKVYTQNAFKICIKFKNTSGQPRPMPEYRTGYDGKIELDHSGNLKLLQPGETVIISIEPSSRIFKFNGTTHWGAAAYPSSAHKISEYFTKLSGPEILETTKQIYANHLEIPFYQISETYKSLYGVDIDLNAETIGKQLPKHMIIRRSKLSTIGILMKNDKLSNFPVTYGQIPLVKGTLVQIKVTKSLRIKK